MDCAAHWRGRQHYTMFVAGDEDVCGEMLAQWQADPERSQRLHLIAIGCGPLPGFARILQDDARVTLDQLHAPLEVALAQLDAQLDAVQIKQMSGLDGRVLARLCVPGTQLRLDDAAQEQRASLASAGFAFDDVDGTRAVFVSRKPVSARATAPQRSAIVLGAGLAGAAACERLCARGWQVTLVERHAQAATEASGNHAGICMPLLSKDDNIPTRLSRAAFLFAQAYWQRLGGLGGAIDGAQCGVLQLARDAAHAKVQRDVAARWDYPKDYVEWLDPAAAGALLKFATPDGGWLFRGGGWARPASVCAAMLAACGERLVRRFGVGSVSAQQLDGRWRVLDSSGKVIAEAPVLIVANGAGALSLAQTAFLPLASVRGQVTHVDEGTVPALPVVLCREAYLTPASQGIHSAGASYDDDADGALRQASQDENLAKLRSLLGDSDAARDAPLRGRVGFRCVAPDRLPLVGALPDPRPTGRLERLRDLPRQPGLFSLLGYASRGLTWAPLAAELLAAQVEGEPLPLERTLVQALDPARFFLRGRTTS
jgi:tRNA 5-methylaminomethyl-2-thiouridine biosynthesis bifunctional protein